MAARLFLTTWTVINSVVQNPIIDYLETQPIPTSCNMYYGDSDPSTGLPKFGLALVLVRAPGIAGATIEQLANLAGVNLVPAIRPSYLLTQIPAAKRSVINNYLTNNGFNLTALNASSTYGDLITTIVSQIAPLDKHPGLLKLVNTIETEFD